MDISQIKKLKALEDENRKLKHMYADLALDNRILKDVLKKSSMQNGYVERFNGSYKRGVLDAYIFKTLDQVREIYQEWQNYYNNTRPHLSLGDMSPRDYK